MKKHKTIHHLIVVDASGSMGPKVAEVRGGLNRIFKDLKAEAKKEKRARIRITVTDFSSHGDFNVLYSDAAPKELKQLKRGDYTTRALTALYDAIGRAFQLVPKKQDAVLVTIFTDGMENDSKEFDASKIRKLISKKQKKGWTVTFMGTTEEAMLQAHEIGIADDHMLLYKDSKAGTEKALHTFNLARQEYQECLIVGEMSSKPFFEVPDEDKTEDVEESRPRV